MYLIMDNNEKGCQMEFICEVKSTKQRKAASLDNVYQIVLETDDPELLNLGKLSPDSLVRVKFEVTDGNS